MIPPPRAAPPPLTQCSATCSPAGWFPQPAGPLRDLGLVAATRACAADRCQRRARPQSHEGEIVRIRSAARKVLTERPSPACRQAITEMTCRLPDFEYRPHHVNFARSLHREYSCSSTSQQPQKSQVCSLEPLLNNDSARGFSPAWVALCLVRRYLVCRLHSISADYSYYDSAAFRY